MENVNFKTFKSKFLCPFGVFERCNTNPNSSVEMVWIYAGACWITSYINTETWAEKQQHKTSSIRRIIHNVLFKAASDIPVPVENKPLYKTCILSPVSWIMLGINSFKIHSNTQGDAFCYSGLKKRWLCSYSCGCLLTGS